MNKICLENYTLCLLGLSIVSNDVGFWKRCIFCFLFYCCYGMCSWFGEVYSTCLRAPHQITKTCRVHLTKSRRNVEYTSPNHEDMSSTPHQITKTCRVHRCTRHFFVIWWGVLDMSVKPIRMIIFWHEKKHSIMFHFCNNCGKYLIILCYFDNSVK
jgi:hypothetical protein